ncbi:MAG: AI-2E family transporter [Rhodospirillales bacterium]
MNPAKQARYWLIGFAVFILVVYVLRDVLLPFVAGAGIAYLLNPLTTRLQQWRCSRTVATLLIMLVFTAVVVAVILLLFPLLQGQIVSFVERVPGYVETLRQKVVPYLEHIWLSLSLSQEQELKDAAGEQAGSAIKWVGGVLKNILSGGLALFQLISLIVITPIVTFYLLRDWEKIVVKMDSWVPKHHADTIRDLARRIDDTIAGFVRGQASVCSILALYYGIALSAVGLEFGLVIGILAGLISFIPYVGASLGFLGSVGLAYAQFSELTPILMVGGVFIVGQILESYFLTPKMVGDRVGLHPVWIIFALMAGGALFGFTGMLLAIPVAAVIGVLARFAISRYLESPLFTGDGSP